MDTQNDQRPQECEYLQCPFWAKIEVIATPDKEVEYRVKCGRECDTTKTRKNA